jgi:lambda family phage tail tape measure protein
MFSPTPVQSQLLKDMSGNASELVSKMEQLQEMWGAVNKQQAGTENINFSLDQANRKMTELRLKSMAATTDIASGFRRGFMKLGLEITNFAGLAEKTITNAFNSMEDALVSFVQTGKVDFKSLVDSMLGDLTRLLARKALMSLLGAAAGGGGVMGFLAGGVMSAGAGAAGGGAGSTIPTSSFGGGAGPAGRARGGPVSPGMNYMVGERGQPEMFTPAAPGHITPASQIGAGGGSNVVIINVASEEDAKAAAASYMNSDEGTRVIQNKVRTANQKGGRG